MENCKERLDYLLELKKTKKDPNKIERDEFDNAWKSLVAEEGYSDSAEYYLYNGLTYCGAAPLHQFIRNSEDPQVSLKKFFAGKLYGANCASTVPILFHLFTLILNEKSQNQAFVSEIIRRIPKALTNKEGKKYGQAGRALKKYILDNLHCDKMPDFGEMIESGLKPIYVKEFISSMDEIIDGLPSSDYSQKCKKNIEILRLWMHPDVTGQKTEGLSSVEKKTIDDERKAIKGTEIKEHENKSVEVAEGAVDAEKTGLEKKTFDSEAEIKDLKKKLMVMNSVKDNLEQQLSAVSHQMDAKNRNINTLKEQLAEKNELLSQLAADMAVEKKHKEEINKKLVDVQAELTQRMQMTEILSRDREKQSDELLKRLASKLKVEYRDFEDAIDIPMDNDLGENMREQLKNVFDILIKAGIEIK